jgi:hypothetical protein
MSNMAKPAAADGGSRQCIGSGQNLTADSTECRNIAQQATVLSLDSTVIGELHRKDMGDIAGLAANIAELGLLHRCDGLSKRRSREFGCSHQDRACRPERQSSAVRSLEAARSISVGRFSRWATAAHRWCAGCGATEQRHLSNCSTNSRGKNEHNGNA